MCFFLLKNLPWPFWPFWPFRSVWSRIYRDIIETFPFLRRTLAPPNLVHFLVFLLLYSSCFSLSIFFVRMSLKNRQAIHLLQAIWFACFSVLAIMATGALLNYYNGQLIEPLYPKTPSILSIIICVRHVHSYKYFIPAAKIQ